MRVSSGGRAHGRWCAAKWQGCLVGVHAKRLQAMIAVLRETVPASARPKAFVGRQPRALCVLRHWVIGLGRNIRDWVIGLGRNIRAEAARGEWAQSS